MYIYLNRHSHTYQIVFTTEEDATEILDLMKELLHAKKTRRCGLFHCYTPKEKQIDEHVTS